MEIGISLFFIYETITSAIKYKHKHSGGFSNKNELARLGKFKDEFRIEDSRIKMNSLIKVDSYMKVDWRIKMDSRIKRDLRINVDSRIKMHSRIKIGTQINVDTFSNFQAQK